MTPIGLLRLKVDEGCKLKAYQDTVGIWTIGYGCTGPGINKDTVWTQSQADGQILGRVKRIEIDLSHRLAWFDKLSEVRQDVLVNIAYNIGVAGLLKWVITLATIGRGDYKEASDDIRDNKLWQHEVHDRVTQCADALEKDSW